MKHGGKTLHLNKCCKWRQSTWEGECGASSLIFPTDPPWRRSQTLRRRGGCICRWRPGKARASQIWGSSSPSWSIWPRTGGVFPPERERTRNVSKLYQLMWNASNGFSIYTDNVKEIMYSICSGVEMQCTREGRRPEASATTLNYDMKYSTYSKLACTLFYILPYQSSTA